MQLGRRWPVGAEPPAGLGDALLDAIRSAETNGRAQGMWTLTWLEGRPRVANDSGLQLDPSGLEPNAVGDDW